MLVGPFQIDICRGLQFLAFTQHASVANARIEPYIEGIGDFFVLIGLVPQHFRRIQIKPGFYAASLDQLCYLFHKISSLRMQFRGFTVDK